MTRDDYTIKNKKRLISVKQSFLKKAVDNFGEKEKKKGRSQSEKKRQNKAITHITDKIRDFLLGRQEKFWNGIMAPKIVGAENKKTGFDNFQSQNYNNSGSY